MAKSGFKAMDSDMHVFEPADLYAKYMNPKWGERIPVGKPRTKHGMTHYFLGDARQKQRNAIGAIDAYQKAINAKPDLYQAYRNLAEAYGVQFKVTKGGDQMHGVVTNVIGQDGHLRARFHSLRFQSLNLVIFVDELIENYYKTRRHGEPGFWAWLKELF